MLVAWLFVLTGCAAPSAEDDSFADDQAPPEAAPSDVAAQQWAPTLESGDNIRFESISGGGTGCPDGSWDAEWVPEANAFTLTFNRYGISAPPTSTPAVSALNCELRFKIRTPGNLSYTVTSFQFFGYANLTAGMRASLNASYWFAGPGLTGGSREMRYDFPVPYDTTYAVNDNFTAQGNPGLTAPCTVQSDLVVRTQIALQNSTARNTGILTIDNLDGRAKASLLFGLQTAPCPARR